MKVEMKARDKALQSTSPESHAFEDSAKKRQD